MQQILAVGTLMVICAMLGAFWREISKQPVQHYSQTVKASDCSHWAPLDAHKDCKWEYCPAVEDETQMVCR